LARHNKCISNGLLIPIHTFGVAGHDLTRHFSCPLFITLAACTAPTAHSAFEGFIMSEGKHTELLISKAYAELLAIPKDGSQASLSLVSIGRCEVRMLLTRGLDSNGVPQFWLELIDHDTGKCIDSFLCHQVKDAAPVFEEFLSHAADSSKSPPDGSKEQ
jgi:hypothetical protein